MLALVMGTEMVLKGRRFLNNILGFFNTFAVTVLIPALRQNSLLDMLLLRII